MTARLQFYCVKCNGACRADHSPLGWQKGEGRVSTSIVMFPYSVSLSGIVVRTCDGAPLRVARIRVGWEVLDEGVVLLSNNCYWPPPLATAWLGLAGVVVHRHVPFYVEAIGDLSDWGFWLRRDGERP
jgi:hypothetical protein